MSKKDGGPGRYVRRRHARSLEGEALLQGGWSFRSRLDYSGPLTPLAGRGLGVLHAQLDGQLVGHIGLFGPFDETQEFLPRFAAQFRQLDERSRAGLHGLEEVDGGMVITLVFPRRFVVDDSLAGQRLPGVARLHGVEEGVHACQFDALHERLEVLLLARGIRKLAQLGEAVVGNLPEAVESQTPDLGRGQRPRSTTVDTHSCYLSVGSA
jgi:hypothetical protein